MSRRSALDVSEFANHQRPDVINDGRYRNEPRTIPEAEKKNDLTQLEAALKTAKPIQFKENIALVLKYFDQLAPIMQKQDSKLRPAD